MDSFPPHINLYNFEEPQFEDSKYVLTSPRSLEACSRLGIKPVELVYKSLSDYQEELLPQGLSLREIYQTFDEDEKERINKLYLCREEHSKVSDEDSFLERCGAVMGETPRKPSSGIQEKAVKAVIKAQDREAERLKQKLEGLDEGSVQRRRTAWTTSIGHSRVTQKELRKRAEEIHREGKKLMNTGINKKPMKAVVSTKKGNALNKKKQERLKKQQETVQNHKSQSTSDVSSIASSSRSSRSPWKDPTLDARPIADPALRKKLQSARGTRVTPRESRNSLPLVKSSDQKILEIMLKKREEEKKTKEMSEKAKEKWASERDRDAAYRAQTASEKRRLLIEERRQKELQRTASDVSTKRYGPGMRKIHSASDATLNRSYDTDQKFGVQLQRKRSEENLRNMREDTLRNSDRQWETASLRAMEAKQRQVEERRRHAMERRKSVEKRLEEQRKEKEELNQLMADKINTDLKRAQSMKESKEKEQILRTKFRNYQTKKKTEERINYLKQQSVEDINQLRLALEDKHKTMEQKAEEERRRKEEELRRKEKGVDSKLRVSKENQKKIDEELETWRKDLLEYRKQQERKAEGKAKQTVMEKKRKAMEERRLKEKLVKENMKKLNQQEDEWKADVEATIAMKDAKSKMLQMEKDEMIQESRALAHASQKLREELRQQYSSNDIDKLNKKTQLEHKVLNKPMASLDINS